MAIVNKIQKNRVWGGVIYVVLGLILIPIALPNIGQVIHKSSVLWCIAWTVLGVGAGLINTRNLSHGHWFLHIICYYGFIGLSVSLLSFVAAIYYSGELWTAPHSKFYSLVALIGLIGGFLGDMFRPIVLRLLGNKDENWN